MFIRDQAIGNYGIEEVQEWAFWAFMRGEI